MSVTCGIPLRPNLSLWRISFCGTQIKETAMPKFYEYKSDGKPLVYELGKAECPKCGEPVVAYFKDNKMVRMEPCSFCSGNNGVHESSEWVQ